MDAGAKKAEKAAEILEKKIKKEYRKAGKEAKAKMETHLSKFKVKEKAKLADLKSGKITAQQFADWRIGQMMTGERWKGLVDELAKGFTEANQTAMRLTTDSLKDAYAANHNFGTFQVEKAAKLSTNYTIYDKTTVEKLIKEKPQLLPKPSVDIPKDLRWNRQKITSAITQGILQGEPINDIAKRLDLVTGMGQRAATRSARTMITSAQNAGRVDSYHRAEEMGIEMEQVWLATEDQRTRQSHLDMNGEAIEVGGTFSNGLKYPADPDGDPSEVYNCRCTLIAKVKGAGGYETDTNDNAYDEWEGQQQNSAFNKDEWLEALDDNANNMIGTRMNDGAPPRKFERYCDDWNKGLTQEEHNAVRRYTSNDYSEWNTRLRNGEPLGRLETVIKDCERALNKASFPQEVIVQRGSGTSALNAIDKALKKDVGTLIANKDKYIGAIMEDKAFLSTTVNPLPVTRDVQYVIKIPKGAHGMYVRPLSEFPSEEELLLQKGSRFIIREIEDVSFRSFKMVRIFMELIVEG